MEVSKIAAIEARVEVEPVEQMVGVDLGARGEVARPAESADEVDFSMCEPQR